MKFHSTKLQGAFVIELEPQVDARGSFARTWCRDTFARRGLNTDVRQCSISTNRQRGTVRGMHWQDEPFPEVKLVRCTRGAIHDVIVDLRPASPTFRQWFGVDLSPESETMLYIPAGVAHGFQTLCDDTEVSYQISTEFHPECSRGIRWNDPGFDIRWPLDVTIISERDQNFQDFSL